MTKKLIVFDTTLRDGEQCPGAAMTPNEKLAIAKMLDIAGINVIETGFAASSKQDFDAIVQIAKSVENAQICSLARATKTDIESAYNAVKYCKNGGRVHTFIATSPIHREFKLKKTKEQILEMIYDSVSFASSLCGDVEWSAEDATRTEFDFLSQCVEVAIKAGAKTVNLPDTVGFATPKHIQSMVEYVKNNAQNIEKAVISMHNHDDLGLAAANTLAGIEAGATQIETTVNGIGERAGNTAFEEVIMAIKTRSDIFSNIDVSHINTKLIKPLSNLVSNITGFMVPNNKAIVGANAFAHESGIHQDGMLKNRKTYEIIEPSEVGIEENTIVLGKHSGRNALKSTIERLGFAVKNEDELQNIFEKFKILASSKKNIADADIIHLLKGKEMDDCTIKLHNILYNNNNNINSVAISITKDGEIFEVNTTGNGTVDAIFKGLKELFGIDIDLDLYQVHAVTGGTDALGSATVRLKKNGYFYTGHASDVDVLRASALAYIDAANLLFLK